MSNERGQAVITAAANGKNANELAKILLKADAECYRETLTWLCEADTNEASTIKKALSMIVNSIPVKTRIDCVNVILDAADAAGNITMLPFVSDLVRSMPDEVISSEEDDDGILTGETYTNFIVDHLIRLSWDGPTMLVVVQVLRDFQLNQKQIVCVLNKFIDTLHRCAALDIPAICYHVLLLGRKGDASLVARALIVACENTRATILKSSEKAQGAPFLQAFGTVLLNISFAVNQDQEFGKVVLKIIKTRQVALKPFALSVLLVISRLRRLQNQIMDFLESYIFSSMSWRLRTKSSLMLSSVVSHIVKKNQCSQGIGLFENMDTCFAAVVSDAEQGRWDDVIPQLVEVGLRLLRVDIGKKGAPFRWSSVLLLQPALDEFHASLTSDALCARLGSTILRRIFSFHTSVRCEIIDRLVLSITCVEDEPVKASSELSKSSAHLPAATLLLGKLIAVHPHVFLDYLEKIRTLFDYLHALPPAHAKTLILSLSPLLLLRSDLKDSLAISLRKAVFSRHEKPRIMAVEGFLVLASTSRVSDTPFEASQSSSAASSTSLSAKSSSETKFFLEVFGLLRRAMTQQAIVREHLYVKLSSLFASCPSLRIYIVQLMTSQLERVYESGETVQPPMRGDLCIESSVGNVLEPLPSLFHFAVSCVLLDNVAARSLLLIVDGVVRRLLLCKLEQLHFEQSQSQSQSASDTSRSQLRLTCLMWIGVLESSMHYLIMSKGLLPALDKVIRLHSLYRTVLPTALAKPKPLKKGERAKSDSSNSIRLLRRRAYFELDSVIRVLEGIHGRFSSDGTRLSLPNSESRAILERTETILTFTLESCAKGIQSLRRRISSTVRLEEFEKVAATLSPLLIRELHRLVSKDEPIRLEYQDPAVLYGITEVHDHTTQQFNTFIADVQQETLLEMGGSSARRFLLAGAIRDVIVVAAPETQEDEDLSPGARHSSVVAFCFLMEAMFKKLTEQRLCNKRIGAAQWPLVLLGMVQPIVPKEHVEKRITFARNVLNTPSDNPVLASIALQHLTKANRRFDKLYMILFQVAENLVMLTGDIDDMLEPTQSTEHKLINDGTKAQLLAQIILRVNADLGDVEWVMAHLKVAVAATSAVQVEDVELSAGVAFLETIEHSVEVGYIKLLKHAFQTIRELVRMNDSGSIDAVLRTTVRLYKTVVSCTKHLLAVKRSPPASFRQLIEYIGKNVTQQVHAAVQLIEAKSSDNPEKKITAETKLLPQVIYQVEEFEHAILKYSKVTKIDLGKNIRSSGWREFRFNIKRMALGQDKNKRHKKRHRCSEGEQEGQEEQEEQEEEEEEEQEVERQDDDAEGSSDEVTENQRSAETIDDEEDE